MNLAPVVLFVYNRPWHTQKTLEALANNSLADCSNLYIYADGPKANANAEDLQKIQEVEKIVNSRNWCRKQKFIKRDQNWGLADSIVDGVTSIVNKHGKIIVLEDDIETSSGFLKYMNEALNLYENEGKVMHISGYMFPVKEKLPSTFFYNTASCWGWGTWARAWENYNNDANFLMSEISEKKMIDKFNVENTYTFYPQLIANAIGKKKTWAVKWYASFFLKEGHSLHPYPSLTNNIGHDGMGENCGTTSIFQWNKITSSIEVNPLKIRESKKARRAMKRFNKKIIYRNNSKNKITIRKVIASLIPQEIKHGYKMMKYSGYRKLHERKQELLRIKSIPRYINGHTSLLGKELKFIDSASFLFIYDEIFKKEIYNFASTNPEPYIIDAGANIGLAVIYFKQLYPNAKITAFEPDDKVFQAIEQNVKSFELKDVTLIKKALWHEESVLSFMSDGADAGRIATNMDKEQLIKVETIKLRKFLNRKVDLLKIDIEGAEAKVLEDCKDLLCNVDRLFVEYHSFSNMQQELHKILAIMEQSGFRYNIQHIGVFSKRPFLKINSNKNMDLQLNIYAYKL